MAGPGFPVGWGVNPTFLPKVLKKTLKLEKKLVPGYHQGLVDLPMNSPVVDLGARCCDHGSNIILEKYIFFSNNFYLREIDVYRKKPKIEVN